MDYLNLDTGECKENAKIKDFTNFQYKVKGSEELLNKVSDNIFFEYKEFKDFLDEFLIKYKFQIKGINSNLQIGYEENLKKADDYNIGIDLGNCPEIIRTNLTIKQNDKIINKVIDFKINGQKKVKYYLYTTDDLTIPSNLSKCENQNITIVYPPNNYFWYCSTISRIF